MKKLLLVLALLMGTGALYNTVEAQNINISINIGRQPAWGPVGYDYVGYYYFPDIDIYYNVDFGMFYYYNRGRWIQTRHLPYRYHNYDLYGLHKVVLNVNNPWRYHNMHRRDYARYVGYKKQVIIRDSRDLRYRDSRNNRVAWYSDNKRPNRNNDYTYSNSGRSRNSTDYNRYTNQKGDRNTRSESNRTYSKSENKNNNGKTVERKRGNSSNSKETSVRERASTKENNTRKEGRVTRPSSTKSKDYRLVSNTEQNNRRGR